jgi:hypothetical protein
MSRTLWTALTIFLLLNGSAQSTTIYQSQDNNGNVSFSDNPSDTSQHQKKMIVEDDPIRHRQTPKISAESPEKTERVAEKLDDLQERLQEAYASLEVAREALHSAKQQQEKWMKNCKESSDKKKCKPESLRYLEVKVVEAESETQRLEVQLNQLRR